MEKRNAQTHYALQQYNAAVDVIKQAILQSQFRSVKLIAGQQISLYFGIGRYVSANSRSGTWGTGAINRISEQLRKEMPGLRGFSEQNIRNMRFFAEYWSQYLNCSPLASEFKITDNQLTIDIDGFSLKKWSPIVNIINRENFLSISFSHHMEILHKTKDLNEVLFYINQSVLHKWDKYDLRNRLKENLFQRSESATNNFLQTMPIIDARKAYIEQLQTYMKVLDDKIRKPHENPTIGILLCKNADKTFVEYVIRDYNSPMGVATYKTTMKMDEKIRNSLPDVEDMRKLLIDEKEE